MIDYSALAGRVHGGRPTVPIVLSAEERARVEAVMRPAKAEQRVVRRAQAVLMMADGVPGTDRGHVDAEERRDVVLARGSFMSTEDLATKLEAYVAWYLATDRPFRWSYRPKSWD